MTLGPSEQPVLVGAVVTALVGLASKYGLELDGDIVTAITLLVGAVVAVVVRQAVTPNPRVPLDTKVIYRPPGPFEEPTILPPAAPLTPEGQARLDAAVDELDPHLEPRPIYRLAAYPPPATDAPPAPAPPPPLALPPLPPTRGSLRHEPDGG